MILNITLPNQDRNDFRVELTKLWGECDNLTLEAMIWRGRILRTANQKQLENGGGINGVRWKDYLKSLELTEKKAKELIELADSHDKINPPVEAIAQFTPKAFNATAEAEPEIQQITIAQALEGQHISFNNVKRINDEYLSKTSPLLPDNITEGVENGLYPSKHVAGLVKELTKLPPLHVEEAQKELEACGCIDDVKDITREVKALIKYLDNIGKIEFEEVDIPEMFAEAQRLDIIDIVGATLSSHFKVQELAAKLEIETAKLENAKDRVFVETGASAPQLRAMLKAIED